MFVCFLCVFDLCGVSNKIISSGSVFTEMKNLWKLKMIELGGEYLLWSNAPENPLHN